MTRYRVLAWRGIPMQVKAVQEGARPVSRLMPPWFGEHVDRVAMRDGLFGSEAYLEALEWSAPLEREGSAEEVADAVLGELDAQWAAVRRRWEETGELG